MTLRSIQLHLVTAFFIFALPQFILSQEIIEEDHDATCNKSHSVKNMIDLRNYSNPLTESYDLKYYRFNWEIDPAVYAIKGSATPYFQVLTDDFNEINFDFSSELIIDSVLYKGKILNYSQIGEYQLNIQFPVTITKGSLDSISIFYHGEPPPTGFGSFIQDTHGDDDDPALWTLSEPFGSQDWWPCKNGLDDKIDSIDVHVITQLKYGAASNGTLVERKDLGNDLHEYHWKHRYPIAAYLVAISVTNYLINEIDIHLNDGTVIPMVNYVYPESTAGALGGLMDNARVLIYFDSMFVDYPFKKEKYGHAQFGWGGGMEHQTMSFVSNFNWGLLAHELAHQWFGDMVTCGSWEDIWLNEGFATYLEGLSRERFQPAQTWYSWKFGKIQSITSRTDGSVKVDDTTSVNRIFSSRLSYSKGSYLLHMLRWKLGDELFFNALRNYLNAQAYSFAYTSELKAELEAVSGQNLTEFFEDWYEGEGHPFYQVTWDQEPDRLLVKLDQLPSDPSVAFFEMPVPIKLFGEGQELTLRLDHNKSGQIFELNPPFSVDSIHFDPDLWLLALSDVQKGDIVLVRKLMSSAGINVFPNPVHDFLTIDQEGLDLIDSNWSLIDVSGKLIRSGTISKTAQKIDVSTLIIGTYRLMINKSGSLIYNASLVKI